MPDFLEEKQREIRGRMNELRPLVDEFHRLEAALHALEGVGPSPTPRASRPARRSGGGGGRSTAEGGGDGRRGRPKGSGTRGKEALSIVTENPGISIPELAEKMGIKQNYLYRVMPDLQKEGLVRKEGRGWHRVEAA